MSRQPMLHRVPPSMFKQLLLALSLITLTASLLGCKPSVAPLTNSPLQMPTLLPVPLPSDIARKLTPSAIFVSTLAPLAFAPEPNSTPAGTGAIGHMLPAFFVHQIDVENVWFEDTAGGTIRTYVYAGSKPGSAGESTQQGLVIVQVLKMSMKNDQRNIDVVFYKEFPTSNQVGPVSVIEANGERLVLQSSNGTTFYFDVPLRQFVPSLAWTPTPGPISPIATPTLPPATAMP